ncbi:MAG: hypothetical protein COB88_06990 [Flavobacteriales bacterium]|nr:MAG: hypothetical protein COB88_06990 [Flavobacteriales bacterium]
MKKSLKLFAFAILAGLAFSTSACNKCQTCTLTFTPNGTETSTEICDDKNAQDAEETACNNVAANDPDFECKCKMSFLPF